MTNRRINTTIIIKVSVAVAVSCSLLILIESRGHPARYFSTRCLSYGQKDFSRKLNDRIIDYSEAARERGISPCKSDRELRQSLSEGKLVRVRSGRKYIIDRMIFSYPAVTPGSKILLDEISRRFRDKVSQKGLYGSRFYITSMTRMPESLRSLRRYNSNSSANSPHLYGNAFDISYKRFSVEKMFLTGCDIKYLKEALAEVIWQLRDEHKCWATYERMQNCFHVVSR